MDARSELLAYMGAATVTVVVLFGLQMWYASYLNVAVVHARSTAPLNPKVEAHRAEERKKLESGPLPLAKAKDLLVKRGRATLGSIAPAPSDDLSAMSGWMHRPNFRPYEPRKRPAAEAAAVQAEPTPGAAEVAAAPAPAAPPPAAPPAKPTRAPKPAPAAHP